MDRSDSLLKITTILNILETGRIDKRSSVNTICLLEDFYWILVRGSSLL